VAVSTIGVALVAAVTAFTRHVGGVQVQEGHLDRVGIEIDRPVDQPLTALLEQTHRHRARLLST
jgi:hypothetical protein